MRPLVQIAFFSLGLASASIALAQEGFVPALAQIMSAAQAQHMKLWLAGKSNNWDLASYELRQIRGSLEEAATHYHGIPVEAVGATVEPNLKVSAAIAAKDRAAFVKSFNALTAACNSCHAAVGRGFIVIQTPTSSPFGNQSFSSPKSSR